MKRYWKIYKTLLRINLANTVAYRTNFINSVVGNFAWSIFGIISMLLLTSKASNVLGWTREELLVLTGCYHIVMSVFYIFFSRNFQQFADTVYFGKLDTYLTKPIDAQFLLSTQFIGFTSLIRFMIGVVFLAYLFWQFQIQITLTSAFIFFVLLIFSVIILYSIWFSVLTITFWSGKLTNLIDLLYTVNSLLRNPGDFYRTASLGLYVALFPFMVIMTNPVKALVKEITWVDTVVAMLLAVCLFIGCRMFWKFALKNYTSASA